MAKRHYKNGAEYYAQANFSEALAEFKKADSLAPVPELKFNIGRCYEGLGRFEEAIAAYRQYLEVAPETKDRASILARIENLKTRARSGRQPAATPEPEEAGGNAGAPETSDASSTGLTERPEQPGSTRRLLGWTAVGVGAAALITAGVLGGLTLSKTGEYEDAHANHEAYADARGLLEDAESFETGSFVALGVGIAAAAGGVILLLLDGSSSTSDDKSDDGSEDLATRPRGPTPLEVRVTGTGLRLNF